MSVNFKKKKIIEFFSKKINISKGILISKFINIESNKINKLRIISRNKFIYLQILKNKLSQIIIKNSLYKNIFYLLNNSLIYFLFNDFFFTIKIVINFFKKFNKLNFLFLSYIYKKYNLHNLKLIYKIPNKKTLILYFLNIIKKKFIYFLYILKKILNFKKK